jgi:hypothetical protein
MSKFSTKKRIIIEILPQKYIYLKENKEYDEMFENIPIC